LRFDGDGSLIGRYLHGEAVDQIFAEEVGGQTRWTLTDHLGSVRDVLSDISMTLGRITYDSFGQVTNTTGIVDTLFRYTARPGMSSTGLYDYRARVYDPHVGQFLSEDPIGFTAGDPNLRRYVGNEPTRYTDPTGLVQSQPGPNDLILILMPDGSIRRIPRRMLPEFPGARVHGSDEEKKLERHLERVGYWNVPTHQTGLVANGPPKASYGSEADAVDPNALYEVGVTCYTIGPQRALYYFYLISDWIMPPPFMHHVLVFRETSTGKHHTFSFSGVWFFNHENDMMAVMRNPGEWSIRRYRGSDLLEAMARARSRNRQPGKTYDFPHYYCIDAVRDFQKDLARRYVWW
jgi:RHS repeat-associated protein